MFFSSLLNKKSEKVSLLLDISSGTVSGSFVSFNEMQKPRVVHQVSLSFTTVDTQSSYVAANKANMIQQVTTCVDKVLVKLFENKVRVSRAYLTFSPPWCESETSAVHIEQEKKFLITEQFLQDVLLVESKKFLDRIEKKNKIQSKVLEDKIVIEKRILQTEINGYGVPKSLGIKTNIFDITVVFSAISEVLYKSITDKIFEHTHIHPNDVTIQSFFLSSYLVMYNLFQMDYVFIDVLGDTTNIFLVQKGLPQATATLPLGTHFVIRKIAEKYNVSSEIAASMLKIALKSIMNTETTEEIYEILADIEKEWAIYFADALASFDSTFSLPTQNFLSVTQDLLPIYFEYINIIKTDVTAA